MPEIISNSSPIIHLAKIDKTGTLGILLRAKHESKLASFQDVFDQLRATGFWINERLRRRFLAEAGEL